jgi:NAD(P)-dependent dehydrogenase (short-subunit alcohol dehydrogenase family)
MRQVAELMNLSGRVALVSGGAGGIGTAVVEALAELGAAVVILDFDRARADALAGRISTSARVRAIAIATDIEDRQNIPGVVRDVEQAFGRLDILVNCAALVGTSALDGWAVPFEKQSVSTWERGLAVNLTAAFVLTQSCARLLAANGCGSIINVSSIYGVVGPDPRLYENTELGNPAAYAASKAGLLQLTRWLATMLAPRVRVNAMTPGGVWRNQPELFVKRYVDRTPLRRMATEEDFKGAVAYLASDLSSYVTGQNLIVDGGWTTW